MYWDIDKVMKNMNSLFEFKYSTYRNGRTYETLRRAIVSALNTDKVSIILTKNKKSFRNEIVSLCDSLGLDFEMTSKSYDIYIDRFLLVKIIEDLKVLDND